MEKNFELGLYLGTGYAPLFESERDWMVAMHNGRPFPGHLQRHATSDAAFVLMSGRAILLVGDAGPDASAVKPVELALFQGINVKRNVWYGVLTSPDVRMLIVQSRDVTKDNSEYWACPADFLHRIRVSDIYGGKQKEMRA